MPLVLLSKPVGASGTCVLTETTAKVTAAAVKNSFMGSASSSGLRAGLRCEYHLGATRPRLKKEPLPNSATPLRPTDNAETHRTRTLTEKHASKWRPASETGAQRAAS